jgi:hypothetical protein
MHIGYLIDCPIMSSSRGIRGRTHTEFMLDPHEAVSMSTTFYHKREREREREREVEKR